MSDMQPGGGMRTPAGPGPGQPVAVQPVLVQPVPVQPLPTPPSPMPAPPPVGVMDAPPAPPAPFVTNWNYGSPGGRREVPRPKKSIAIALAVVLVAGVGAFFFLNRSGGGGGTAFALSFSKGQVYRYRMSFAFNGSVSAGGQQIPMNMQASEIVAWHVESVDADGAATVEMTIEKMSATVNGQRSPEALPQPVTIRVAKDGRILTAGNLQMTGGGGDFGAMFPGTDQITPILPDHAVKPGDFWTKTFDQELPFGAGRLHYVTHNLFLRYETVDGIRAAVISSSVKLPLDMTIDLSKLAKSFGGSDQVPKGAKMVFGGSAEVNETSWLDFAHGQMLSGSANGKIDMTIEFKDVPGAFGGKASFAGTMTIDVKHLAGQATPEPSPSK